MRKYIKYTVKGLAILVGVLVLIYIAIYAYVAANKKSIIQQIKEQADDKLNGDIQINDIGLTFLNTFPRISVELENISIKDTLFSQHHHPFFAAKKVYVNLSLTGIIQKTNPISGVRIDNGQVYIYTDTSGYTNAYLLSPKSDKKTPQKNAAGNPVIDIIKLREVRLILNNQLKRKLYDFDVTKFNCVVTTEDSTLRFKTKNNILIHNLAFNTKNGSFLKEARFEGGFNVFFNKTRKQLSFDDLDVTIKDHPFNLSGVFNFTKSPSFSFKAATKKIDYNFARSLLTEKNSKALSVVKLGKPIDEISAEISGPMNGGNPLVHALWKCNKTDIQSSYANFTNSSFNGSYTNELVAGLPRKDSNSRVQLNNFSGLWEGLPIKSQNIYIDNLKVPMVNADIKTDFDLIQLNTLIGSSSFDMHSGKGLLDITYSGPLEQNTNKNTLLNGKLTFSDGVLMYHPRNIELKNLNGNIVFKNSDVFVQDLRGNVQGNKIEMNGSGKNLLALMKTNPGKMVLDWNVYSPSLNLSSFTSLLKKRGSVSRKNNLKSRIGNNIDEIVNQANFHLDLRTDELKFKRFTATNVKASVSLINENWVLNNVSLNHGGGSMVMSGSLNEKNSKYFAANIKTNMQNVDVNKIFYAFNNFGQNGISSENLRGKLTSLVNVKMDIDRDLEGKPANMEGFIDFSLKNGALLNYEPLRKIGDLAFTKRNFDKIYFAEIKDRFDIKNREIVINRMVIESTVLTLFVEGIYSLGGKTDISIQVPLSNIKSRDRDYKLENKGGTAKGGASIFVRGVPGDDGNMKFKLDLFKKFRKKDNKEKGDKENDDKEKENNEKNNKDKRETKSKS